MQAGETAGLLPDTALSDPSLDRLDRAPFARSLSNSILNLAGNDSFVVGLCGPWGSGKTSVLNFVVSDLEGSGENAPIILRFNPWWFSGRDQLLESYLAQFGSVLQAPKRGDNAKKTAKLLSTLSAGLRPLALIPFIGEAVKVAREATDAVAGASTAYAEAVQKNVVEIRKEIDALLKDLPSRVIVVMDDIDRLAADEIAQLFLILKAVADFPRTVYLLAFDHQIVAQAIHSKLGVDGKAYLEKIVQLQIDVPPTAHTSIHQMFVEQLNELLKGDPFEQSESQAFWNVFHDGIKHFLITPRAVKKLINMLRFAYPPLRGEVRIVDMVAISCLTTFVPQVIPIIATNSEHFVGAGSSMRLGGHDQRKESETFHRGWLDLVPKSDREAVEGIVRRVFPLVNHALGGPGHSSEFETGWRTQLRACSSAHFEKYFRLAIPDGSLSESEWNHLTSLLADTDDTRVPIQAPGEGKCRQGRIWTYIGDNANPYIVYDYTPDRTRAGPANWLRGYTGYLQADAYGGYDGIFHSGAIEVACWAHARRKFFEAKDTDGRRAAAMLSFVRELYAVEDDAKSLRNDERRTMRQVRSVPILNDVKTWLDRERNEVLPRSPIAAAITYALNQWDALNVYVTEGCLNIDNNAAERALKRVAIGRKNWLFAGNDRAGGTAALLYSLIASAERHQLDPQRYLTSLLARLPGLPPSDLGKLLPDVWKRADVENTM